MRHLSGLILLALLMVAPLTVLRGEERHDDPLAAEKNCVAAELAQMNSESDTSQAELDVIKKQLEAQQTQPAPSETMPSAASTPPAQPPPAAAALAEVAQATEQLSWARDLQEQARQALAAVAKAPNPAAAQVALKDVESKVEAAQNIIRRVRGSLHPNSAPSAAAASRPALNLRTDWPALQQAVVAAKLQGSKLGYTFADSGDNMVYDAASERVTVPGGGTIDVHTMAGTFRQMAGPKVPLFEKVKVPGATRAVERLNPEAVKLFRSPQTAKQLKDVGGVELQVTLDLLGFLGVPEFRRSGPATMVDSPVLISLTALQNHLRPYAHDWSRLPDKLRYPGEIERVHGFVLDPAHQDVVLVGSRASRPEQRLDIDALIVALRSVWRDGETPGVSLDPLPDEPGGPQYARVIAVPPNSTFARIMLDADYAMKRIILGSLAVNEPGYRTYGQLLAANPRLFPRERFWFYPTPLGAGDVHVSATARTVLFETGLRVLTESQRLVEGAYAGTGAADETALQAAQLFTEALPAFEGSREIEPRGIFTALHGLVDLVTVCKIWRETGVDYPCLRALSQLPIMQLAGKAAVPSYYRGLSAVYARFANGEYYLTGGVLARARANRNSLDRYQDYTTTMLEQGVDRFPRQESFVQTLPLRFTLPRAGGDPNGTAERLLLAGQAALARGEYDQARTSFTEATQADPFYADAWAYLGLARSGLGEYAAAVEAIARAISIEPGDEALRVVALDIRLRANPQLDLQTQDESIRRKLGQDYLLRAGSALAVGKKDEAWRLADTALLLWDENADAYSVRAIATSDRIAANRDWIEAIRGFRKLLGGDEPEQAKWSLAFALTMRALARTVGIDYLKAATDPSTNRQILDELQQAVDESQEARQIDRDQPLALITEAHARALRVAVFQLQGNSGNIDTARRLAEEATRRFPDISHAHFTYGVVLRVAGDTKGAIDALSEAIKLDPTFGNAFQLRADLHAERKECAAALADLSRAKAQLAHVNEAVAQDVLECR